VGNLPIGVIGMAFAGSANRGTAGGQAYASFNTSLFGFSLSASTLRTIGGYNDLASLTARPFGIFPVTGFPPAAFTPGWFFLNSLSPLRPPKIQDQFSAGFPLPVVGGSLTSAKFMK
jgi:outer membrane usher protein